MIKYFCDRCGVEMTKEKRHGFVSVNTRDKAEGDLLEENEFESWLFCKMLSGILSGPKPYHFQSN